VAASLAAAMTLRDTLMPDVCRNTRREPLPFTIAKLQAFITLVASLHVKSVGFDFSLAMSLFFVDTLLSGYHATVQLFTVAILGTRILMPSRRTIHFCTTFLATSPSLKA
jgi:hypothetical protein